MKLFSALPIIVLLCLGSTIGSKEILFKMYDRYKGKWYTTHKFVQTTERYRNDSLVKTETWHETLIYPDLFRIDFGDLDSSNAVIYNNDSSYFYRKGKLARKDKDENELLLFLGGMYFQPLDSVINHFLRLGYDLDKSCTIQWKGKTTYIIGANDTSSKVNQLWIDAEKLIAVRFFKYDTNTKEEGIFEDHVMLGEGWSETKAIFYFNDKLIQVEKYYDNTVNQPIDKALFDPHGFKPLDWGRH